MEKPRTYKEPYSPENTPPPPQVMNPNGKPENNEKDRPAKGQQKKERSRENKYSQRKQKKSKLLGESETEINDETTI
jgi:hypothetical protein